MNRKLFGIILIAAFCFVLPDQIYAQLPEEFGERLIRVAGPGELVDSVNVWGDINSSGRYLVPEGTNLPELISYSFGYSQVGGAGARTGDKWAKTQIEVKVSRYIKSQKLVEVAYFRYMYHDPEPVEMFEFELQNNDIITLQVRKKPTFTDYIGVVAPVVGVIATSILLIENLRGD